MDTSLAALIDHTLLKPDATSEEIGRLCAEARQYLFASVCVNPYWVPMAVQGMEGSPVSVCAVVGFPLGANTTEIKVAETLAAARAGAREVDMVLNIGELRGGNHAAAEADIRAVVQAARAWSLTVKVILETALLATEHKILACRIARAAGAQFVKTSTGFGPAGATVEDVSLMRRTVGPDMGVKASGGIRTLKDCRSMIAAGATRIGASASVKIMEETVA